VDTRSFRPGIRLSVIDVIILFVGCICAADIGAVAPWFGVAIAFVILHFFLFCNIVRMARRPELAWAVVFVALAALNTLTGSSAWPVVLTVSFVFTVILIGFEIRKPSYHGVFWRRLNPKLPQWWEAQA
jgi:F0F1-type ATP synthase membrane subunit a